MNPLLPVLWVGCGAAVVVSAVRSRHDRRANRSGMRAVAALYLGAGAFVNTLMLMTGEDYADFADGSYIPFVHHTWRSLVVPNHHAFIWLLIAFETAVGLLALAGGRKAPLGLVAAMAFHVALLSFGWGFYLWSIPMLAALGQLLRDSRPSQGGAAVLGRDQPTDHDHGRVRLTYLPLRSRWVQPGQQQGRR
jgi:hypothetical protein